ncbi:MAG: Multi-sensor signal transduction histidine kinase [Chthoniobacteraceae bacterium]|nr:Multi-sensor signal transduction histidine kinase [Chthoniobacteraceae bacterium]
MPGSLSSQRSSIGRKVLIGFGLVLAMLVTIAFMTWRSIRNFAEKADLVERSYRVLEASEKLFREVIEMENHRRGFLLSGEKIYLTGYDAAREDLVAVLSAIKRDTKETLGQGLCVARMEHLLAPRFAMRGVDLQTRRESANGAAAALFNGPEEDEFIRVIRQEMAGLQVRERRLLDKRSRLTDAIEIQTLVVMVVGTILTLIALVSASGTILRDVSARRRAEEVLADQHNLLSSIIDTMPDHVFVKDVKGRYIMDNRAHRQFLELVEGESIEGKTVFDFFPKAIATLYDADDQEVFERGVSLRNREELTLTRSGVESWLSTTKVPLRDPAGRILGLVCVSADITERKGAEEQLKRFASQLERSNAELQNFASVASHDLQEPLRKIQAFGDRLRVKCGPQLGEAGLDYLGRMQNAAERMRVLIQDLLKLTRVTSRAQPFERCDLNAVVREVLSDLEVAIEQKAARVQAGPLPVIDADPVQMRQLFQNLISNALKFQGPGETPKVEVDAQESGEEMCQITIKDNGIGFGPQFAEQIFVVFQRLHSRSEYEGTGIGLAVCRKITDRHGGTIVAKSTEGHGATFIVTLPLRQPSHQTHE